MSVFSSRVRTSSPSSSSSGIIPNISFSFLQTGPPDSLPGLFQCCRDDGEFCTRLVETLQELGGVRQSDNEVLLPSTLQEQPLYRFLDSNMPQGVLPAQPIGNYRLVARGSCVPSPMGSSTGASSRPCAPCQTARLCGAN